MTMLPKWATAPSHQKKVIATDDGWVVEETGEILYSCKNLPERLKELHKDVNLFLAQEQETATASSTKSEPVEPEPVKDEEETTPEDDSDAVVDSEPVKETPKPKPRRGRKPKAK